MFLYYIPIQFNFETYTIYRINYYFWLGTGFAWYIMHRIIFFFHSPLLEKLLIAYAVAIVQYIRDSSSLPYFIQLILADFYRVIFVLHANPFMRKHTRQRPETTDLGNDECVRSPLRPFCPKRRSFTTMSNSPIMYVHGNYFVSTTTMFMAKAAYKYQCKVCVYVQF